ncbi:MAG: hypothetical protein WCA98_00935 [Candidatus Acidiferrales bacterium]
MKKRAVGFAALAILVLLAGMYLRGHSRVPPGQEPLVTLSNANFSEFENAFDADSDAPRLVLLLSPT